MNANLLAILKQIIAEQGESVLADPPRLKALFSDYAKNEQKEERVAFGRCIEMGAYQELKKTSTANERQRVKTTLADQVNAKTGIDRARCAEALDLLEAVIFKPEQQSQGTFCSKCGKELQKEWTSCPYCSTPVANNVCSKCGKELKEGWISCPYCSTPTAKTEMQVRQSLNNEQPRMPIEAIETEFENEKVTVFFDGKEIVAKNSFNPMAFLLYVDNQLIAKDPRIITPLMSTLVIETKYKFESGERTIQVYAKSGLVFSKLKICVI